MGPLFDILTGLGEYFPESFVISDLVKEDQPLIYINPNFQQLTGYTKHEVLGLNCRFLQGPLSNKETIKNIRNSLKGRRSCFFDLLNHKKNGAIFWNRLVLVPFGYNQMELDYCLGIQQNVSDKYDVEKYFLENVKQEELAKEVKNPLMEVFNAYRSLKYIAEDIEKRQQIQAEIRKKLLELNQYIKQK